ncbi:MAG: hypothetical protein M1837_004870 [Sclerophora amabilis]|nr:MAG: hypothetical protein M1837_004870 [Sclerophora amabilis]
MHLTLSSIFLASFAAATLCAPQVCNGHAELCGLKYSNVSHVGAHNSAFVGDLPQDNQDVSVPAQLDAGIRFLQSQTQKDIFGTLSMCHTSCFLRYAGSLESYLSTIKTWLDAHPNEVLTLLLTNGDNVDISMFDTAFTDSDLKKYAFVPATHPATLGMDSWPTLQELISSGKRLVTFLGTYHAPFPSSPPFSLLSLDFRRAMHLVAARLNQIPSADYGADHSQVPYLLDEFAYFFETPFDTTDPAFPQCDLDRPAKAKPDGRMYIVNHFLDINIDGILIPDHPDDTNTNAATGTGSIGAQVDLCTQKYGRRPNFVLVDFFDQGDVFTAEKRLNGL